MNSHWHVKDTVENIVSVPEATQERAQGKVDFLEKLFPHTRGYAHVFECTLENCQLAAESRREHGPRIMENFLRDKAEGKISSDIVDLLENALKETFNADKEQESLGDMFSVNLLSGSDKQLEELEKKLSQLEESGEDKILIPLREFTSLRTMVAQLYQTETDLRAANWRLRRDLLESVEKINAIAEEFQMITARVEDLAEDRRQLMGVNSNQASEIKYLREEMNRVVEYSDKYRQDLADLRVKLSSQHGPYTLRLLDFGGNKINCIRVVRQYMGLSLREAKNLVEGAPINLKVGASWETCQLLMREISTSLNGELLGDKYRPRFSVEKR